MNIIFTVCNRTSLAHALALAKSVLQFPENTFYLGWVDTVEIENLPANIHVIPVTKLHIPQWPEMVKQYADFELLPATRPWFAQYLIAQHPAENQFIFLAPTVYLYQSLTTVIHPDKDIQVTPHITTALKKSPILDDKRILNIGMFHAGSWILSRSEKSLQFLNWWAERTIDRAQFDLCQGMCMDQLWLNFVLVRIPNSEQITAPGWHYGLHSVLNKQLESHAGEYLVNKHPLITADFAGLNFFDPVWSDHLRLIEQNNIFKQLYTHYKKEVSSFQKYVPAGIPGFGHIPAIKSNRLLRKGLAKKLVSITRFIDQF